MLHSTQHKTADAAAAGNNPSSAPDPFPHPAGINPLPPRNGHPRSPLPRTRGNPPPLESSGAHPSGNQPDMRRPRCPDRDRSPPTPESTPGAGPHTNRIDARSRRPEINQGPRRRPNSGNPPSPHTRESTQNVPLNGAFMTPIPANAGTNLGRHYRIWRQPPIPAHAGINRAGDAARNGSIPRTHRGSTRVDVV